MADNDLTVVDIGQVSKPLTKIIKAVQAAIGIAYEPTRIRRRANAEADAALILAKAKLKIEGLERRAAQRLISRELRRQENIERIILSAIEELPAEVAEKSVDPDWVIQFFNSCEDITNEQMQLIWAKLLAGEVSQPGSFSPRTLTTLKVMTCEDAVLYNRLCSFVWQNEENLIPILLRPNPPFISSDTPTLTYDELVHLASMGVITSPGIGEVNFTGITQIQYFDDRYSISSNRGLPVGQAVFTEAGRELAHVVKGQPDKHYCNCVVRYWRQAGIGVDEA